MLAKSLGYVYKVGDHLLVKLSSGRIDQATIKAIVDTTDGVRLQVSFGSETALIYHGKSLSTIVDAPSHVLYGLRASKTVGGFVKR